MDPKSGFHFWVRCSRDTGRRPRRPSGRADKAIRSSSRPSRRPIAIGSPSTVRRPASPRRR
jgi:hypothetical protein